LRRKVKMIEHPSVPSIFVDAEAVMKIESCV
jgi:hypothetical protein